VLTVSGFELIIIVFLFKFLYVKEHKVQQVSNSSPCPILFGPLANIATVFSPRTSPSDFSP